MVLKCLQARGRSKSGCKHRTRTTGTARPEERETVLSKVTQPISGRHRIIVSKTVYQTRLSDLHEPVKMCTAIL